MSSKKVFKGGGDKKALAPSLRFPEFLNSKPWANRVLTEIGQTLSGLSGKSGEDFGAGQSYVTYKQVFDSAVIDIAKVGKVKVAADERQNRLEYGDVLFTTSSETPEEVGFASVLLDVPTEPLYLNSFCFCFRVDRTRSLIPAFSRYLFHSPTYRKLVVVLAQGSTRFNISKGAFLKLALPIPESDHEQEKIADCLTSIDDLISAETKKLDALKTHKKGLMQSLFPGEGETLPRLRFPEFKNGPDWILAKLDDISRVQSGGTPSRSCPDYWGGTIPWVTTSLVDSNIILDVDEYITRLGLEESSAKMFPIGTILMAMYGQGKTRGKVAMLGIDATTNQACAAILTKSGIESRFVFQSLVSRYDEIRKISNSGGQENLNAGLVEGIPISYPEDVREQEKIANCLFFVDDLIAVVIEKISTLRTHKMGLMQQLFPLTDKVLA